MIVPPNAAGLQVKEAFWRTVEECLVEFHHLPRAEAFRQVQELRVRLERPPLGLSGDVVYHDEPFDVACRLAGKALDLSSHRPRYEAIQVSFGL